MAKRYFILTIFTLLGLVCVAQPETKMTVDEYIQTYKFAAISEMHEHGVPASITLSQGLIESANGNSRLAREGNNHFGIKCKSDWIGEKIYEDDDSEHECFRAYPSVWDSYKDHSLFLKNGQRYAFLFELDITDYKGWAKGLKKAGYATNPRYADILIGVIERNLLFEYDKVTPEELNKMMGADTVKTVIEVTPKIEKQMDVYNNIPAVKVDGTQSVDEIAVENEIKPKWVKRWNDMEEGQALKPGDMVYLKPKKRKGSERYHTVQEGEDMWEISQTYAIKLKHLYKKNHMVSGTQPAVGEKIYLQEKSETTPDTTKPKAPVVKKEEPKKEPVKPVTTPPVKKEVKETPKPTETKEVKKEEAITHIVKPGETLYSIAKQYNVTVDELKELNSLTGNTLVVGQKLTIKKAAVKVTEYHHTVEAGETLYSISKKYGVTVEQLKQWNNLQSTILSTGQKIIIRK